MSKRDEYVAKMKQQLDELNAEIAKLEAKTQAFKGEAREKHKEQLDKLRQESQAVQDKLKQIEAAGENVWETLVAEADNVWNAFKHSVNYFKSQL